MDWSAETAPFECYVQPKLNGVKALLSPDGVVHKKSGDICHHLKGQFGAPGSAWIDGELWHRDMDLGTIAGLVNRLEPDNETAKLQFWACDLIHPDMPQGTRFDALTLVSELNNHKFNVLLTHFCDDPLIAAQHYRDWQDILAYDGMIYRHPTAGYEFGKTSKVLKRKNEFDSEYLCTGVTEGMGKFFGMLGSFQLVTPEGTPFSCGGGCLTVEDRKAMWKNPPIGQILQVRYPYLSADKIPQCPQFMRVRNNKDI
jgi:ATP-dependent DNA ligase